jgi:hypothetical protein
MKVWLALTVLWTAAVPALTLREILLAAKALSSKEV